MTAHKKKVKLSDGLLKQQGINKFKWEKVNLTHTHIHKKKTSDTSWNSFPLQIDRKKSDKQA